MQAVDGLFRENEKQDKKQRLEKRKQKLSEMLLKETKKYEVNGLTIWIVKKKRLFYFGTRLEDSASFNIRSITL